MTTDLRSMLIGQLSIEEGRYLHLDYWDVFKLEIPATESEQTKALALMEKMEFTEDGVYELQLSASKENIFAYIINCHRLLSAGIPTEQYFEIKP